MKKAILVVGARPNFMKIAPICRVMKQYSHWQPYLVHTGQHYDEKMSKIFFEELELPKPDCYLGVGSGSHAQQTAAVMIEIEKTLQDERADLIVVVGDVNSTLAASVVAVKMGIPIAHVEAGLRSGDRTMPEEINRILTDRIADSLFVTEQSGIDHLRHEGIDDSIVHFVGNVMIDSLLFYRSKSETSGVLDELKVKTKEYALVTLHRPSNVDDADIFSGILNALGEIQTSIPVIFPIHPRSRKMIDNFGLTEKLQSMPQLQLVAPLGYLDFNKLMADAKLVLTDSGGIQEETTALGVPCLTLRENTERPCTVEIGTNQLIGMNPENIVSAGRQIIQGHVKQGNIPPLWDGHAAERIVKIMDEII